MTPVYPDPLIKQEVPLPPGEQVSLLLRIGICGRSHRSET